MTFMSIAPEHALVDEIVSDEQRPAVEAFRAELANLSEEERTGDQAEKKGVFTGAFAINPVNGDQVPVYVANFVLADYGTGAVMAVPAHDTRDFAFATAYDLPIKQVIHPEGTDHSQNGDDSDSDDALTLTEAFTDVGTMANSGDFSGMRSDEAKVKIITWLADQGYGRAKETWRLRDWLISRQRYWGNPIPFVYGETMGAVPLTQQQLPVHLPEDVTFDGIGNPLAKHESWITTASINADQPLTVATNAGPEAARRETDTMDTFVQSSWYYARYTCARAEQPLDNKLVDHWLPVDLYVGGIEHACMHLLYARFFQKALCDAGYSTVREPFKRLLCQGMVVAETYYREDDNGKKTWFNPADVETQTNDKGAVIAATLIEDGEPVIVGRIEKMSKSKNNGVDPQAIVDAYGADTARLFILSDVPPEKDLMWDDAGVAGAHRFLKRLWTLVHEALPNITDIAPYDGAIADLASVDQALWRQMHATIKRAGEAMDQDFGFNVAIAEVRKLFNEIQLSKQQPPVIRAAIETLLLVLAPMTPHVCAELYHTLTGQSIDDAHWPTVDESALVLASVTYPVQVNGKVRGRIDLPNGLAKPELESAAADHPDIQQLIGEQTVRKLIVVPGKIINLVLSK